MLLVASGPRTGPVATVRPVPPARHPARPSRCIRRGRPPRPARRWRRPAPPPRRGGASGARRPQGTARARRPGHGSGHGVQGTARGTASRAGHSTARQARTRRPPDTEPQDAAPRPGAPMRGAGASGAARRADAVSGAGGRVGRAPGMPRRLPRPRLTCPAGPPDLSGVGERHEQQSSHQVARARQEDVEADIGVGDRVAEPYAEQQVQPGDDDVVERPECEEEADHVGEDDAASGRVGCMQQVRQQGQQRSGRDAAGEGGQTALRREVTGCFREDVVRSAGASPPPRRSRP